ncbi:hypothetical protein Vretimale_2440 [Volvox reticuliferus]|uniref:Uncharacterized protein n=1 Tax=Volvox reticuliferus TaxID=1737510 RepID=A0A8J4FHM7_9CHLO|nr:hypothetical protein Vretifemale_4740 [Volvox reticuliferus]GIL96684.1 hypothetical protein Vretimale_2440 [Volvox reticuliferus]
MAPFMKLLAGSSLLAGLLAAVTTRLARRKRKAAPADSTSSSEGDRPVEVAPHQETGSISDISSGSSSQVPVPEASTSSTWRPAGQPARHCSKQRPQSCALQPHHGTELYRRSSESASGVGLLSRLLGPAGRMSESLESAVGCSGNTGGSSGHGGGPGCDEYDSSEEQETSEGGAESSRSGYGKSNRARLVDLWIESALLVSRDVRLDKRHFDRTTRQNLKKMRPASAQLILSEIADRCWDATPDIAREVHRLVSHAKAQDKFAVAPTGPSASALAPVNVLTTALPVSLAGVGAGTAGGPEVRQGGVMGVGAAHGPGPGRTSESESRSDGGDPVVTTAVTALLARGRGAGAAAAGSIAIGSAAAAAAAATPAGGAGNAARFAMM